jgi:hypothetical protein
MAGRVTQAPTRVAVTGDPLARVSQVPVRVAATGDPKARVSQAAVRVMVTLPAAGAAADAEFEAFFVG